MSSSALGAESQDSSQPPATINASFVARALAFGIDCGILGCLEVGLATFIICLPSNLAGPDHFPFITILLIHWGGFILWTSILPPTYFTVFHACGGQTPGKLALGIKVISLAGKPISCGTGFLRSTGYLFSALPMMAGFLWSMADKDRKTWHDILASTRVISGINDLTKN